MTNELIIMNEAQKLAKEGRIQYTGRVLELVTAAGDTVQLPETEAIHTYRGWLERGYQVQKGEKAVAKITIWKHAEKHDKETGEALEARMFMKTAAFFAASQVAPVQA